MDDLDEALERFRNQFGGLPLPSPASYRPSYCRDCDEMTRNVLVDGERLACPACGRQKGILELGTVSAEAWHDMPDDAKPS